MRLQAAEHWTCVDFVSDLHLCPDLPQTTAAFEQYLQQGVHGLRPDALFLLGDVFEVWVGDDALDSPLANDTDSLHLKRCAAGIAACGEQTSVFWIAGNRDFLLGQQACHRMGMTPLPDPSALSLGHETVVLSHGDAACLDDLDYQRFRAQVRAPGWTSAFLSQTLPQRWAQARRMRKQSREQQNAPHGEWVDVDYDWSLAQLAAWNATRLVHGHTHRPATHALGEHRERIVLSDWDLDNSPTRGQVLRWHKGQWQRCDIPQRNGPCAGVHP